MLAKVAEAFFWLYAIAGGMWAVVAMLKWLGTRSPWRRK